MQGKRSKQRRQKKKGFIVNSQQWAQRRDAGLRELREIGLDVPLPPAGALPNPHLGISNLTKCKHGCEIANAGTRAYDMLFQLITGLNAGVDGALGPVPDSRVLVFRVESFSKFNAFDEIWIDGSAESNLLAASLTSIGTDCLLMEGDINTEGQIKMAAAIAAMVQELESRRIREPVLESVRKRNDILDGGERDIVGFFNKRIKCDCLKDRHHELKITQEKTGKCDNCHISVPIKQLKQCSRCRFFQVEMMCYPSVIFVYN